MSTEQVKILATKSAEAILFIACPPRRISIDEAMRHITMLLQQGLDGAAALTTTPTPDKPNMDGDKSVDKDDRNDSHDLRSTESRVNSTPASSAAPSSRSEPEAVTQGDGVKGKLVEEEWKQHLRVCGTKISHYEFTRIWSRIESALRLHGDTSAGHGKNEMGE